jgi:putative glutamine amidotransferase
MKRPLIGIASHLKKNEKGKEMLGSYRAYVDSVERAGGTVVLLALSKTRIPDYVRLLDGLLLTGGGDIHPRFFRGKIPPEASNFSPDARTEFEIAIVRAFLRAQKAILGICLGCQTLNVAFGGDLISDIPTEWPMAGEHREGDHAVLLGEGSKLRKIVGADRAIVNSRHHQAVGKVARGAIVSAISPDEIVEAIELTRHPFAIGVQWHPEDTYSRPSSRKLFEAFVKASRSR